MHYRKIYEQHYGPIPKDSNGRTYEIHHKDNNRKNNDIDNLQCVSIQEHYDIHYSHGDWLACQAISKRMNISPEEKSNICKKLTKKRILEGTHPFLGGNVQRKTQLKLIENNTHIFLDKNKQKERALKRTKEGKNPFTGGLIQKQSNKNLIEKGTHHLLGPNSPTQFQWTCIYCNKSGKGKSNFIRYHSKCK